MTVYVKALLNGRSQFRRTAIWLDEHGITDSVFYDRGSWQDSVVGNVLPHLKFEKEEDALLYVLAFGGVVSKTIPVRQK